MTNYILLGVGLVLIIGSSILFWVWRNPFPQGAFEFARAHNCILNEATVHPCVVDGKDYGPELYVYAVPFGDLPNTIFQSIGVMGVVAGVIVCIFAFIKRRLNKVANKAPVRL